MTEKIRQVAWKKASRTRREPFALYKSIGAPRVRWADSHDLFDTERVWCRRFEVEWARCMKLGVSRAIMRWDEDEEGNRPSQYTYEAETQHRQEYEVADPGGASSSAATVAGWLPGRCPLLSRSKPRHCARGMGTAESPALFAWGLK